MKTMQECKELTQKKSVLEKELDRLNKKFESAKADIKNQEFWRLMIFYGLIPMTIYLIIEWFTPLGYHEIPLYEAIKIESPSEYWKAFSGKGTKEQFFYGLFLITCEAFLLIGGMLLYFLSTLFTDSMWVLKFCFPKYHARLLRIEAEDYAGETKLTKLHNDVTSKSNEIKELDVILEDYNQLRRKVYQFSRDLFNSQGTVKLSDIEDVELRQYLLSAVQVNIAKEQKNNS